MKCPVCDERLVEVRKGDILIDLCPSCKGAWIERMELGKAFAILSGEAPGAARAAEGADGIDRDRQRQQRRSRDTRDDDDDDDERYDGRSDQYGKKRKREGLLSNITDMFGG